jgi:hypothetical protein
VLRPLAVAVATLWIAAPAAALSPQPFSDVTPQGSQLILCPVALGGATGLAWLRLGETPGGRDVLDLGAAGVDPPTPAAQLLDPGGCPSTATASNGATLIALNRTGFANEAGSVFAIDRTPAGATGPAIELGGNERGASATGAIASSGAALVAWTENAGMAGADRLRTTVHVAARDAGGAFRGLGVIAAPGNATVTNLAAGIDDAGYSIAVWAQRLVDDPYDARLMVATRAPGTTFGAPRELAFEAGSIRARLAVGRTGEVLLALAGDGAVRVATGTTRTGLAAPRTLVADDSSDLAAILTATGTAVVAWTQSRDLGKGGGLQVSERTAGGGFGPPRSLVARGTRLAGRQDGSVRLAGAPDGRVLATWMTGVSAGDGTIAGIPVAALRRTDRAWEPAVAVAAPCRETMAAFPGFDAAGRPRALLVDNGYVSAGDYGFPSDTRVRLVPLAGVPATPTPAPEVTLSAPRRQALRDGKVRLRVRCDQACDAQIFAVIRRRAGADSGLFPRYTRLRAGSAKRVSLRHERYFDRTGGVLDREGRTAKVRLVVLACDSAGRIARARRTIEVRVPRRRSLAAEVANDSTSGWVAKRLAAG